jgi:hypothetical protein
MMALLLAGALVLGACAEPPADDAADDTGAEPVASEVMEDVTEPEATEADAGESADDEEMAEMPEGCLASMEEVIDVLSEQVEAKSGSIGNAAKAPLEVTSEMIYGAWEINAVEVTNAEGEQEVAVWATKVLPPGEWSAAADAGEPLAFTVNEVAMSMSDYDAINEDVVGREVTMEDPAVAEAMDCLAQMESDG